MRFNSSEIHSTAPETLRDLKLLENPSSVHKLRMKFERLASENGDNGNKSENNVNRNEMNKEFKISNYCNKIRLLVNELVETEEIFVNRMKLYVDSFSSPNFLEQFNSCKCIMDTITVLEKVYVFHRGTLLPELQASSTDIDKFAKVFLRLINENYFYCHIEYNLHEFRILRSCKNLQYFFDECRKVIKDQLGFESLLLEPTQRLPRYEMLLEKMLQEMMKQRLHMSEVQKVVVTLSMTFEAVKNLNRVVNGSLNLFNIDNVHILEPWIWQHGKFIDLDQFDMQDTNEGKLFKGYVFLFEKCILYTEAKTTKGDSLLYYKGYLDMNHVSVVLDSSHHTLTIGLLFGILSLKIYGRSSIIIKWEKLISDILNTP
ncbi:hypothetical protein DMENIID0001_055360 [Sergentomyia squamirostris]